MLAVEHAGFAWSASETVLRDVNFIFDGKGVLSILGPNGAGKTTLLRAMLGLLPWTTGRSVLDGRPLTEWPARELWQRIGYVPQAKRPGFAAMSVAEMVLLGRSAHLGTFAQPGAADRTIAQECMEAVGIPHLAKRLCSEISGGQYQLALIARALCAQPQLLVLDEPESNLDFKNQQVVLDVIASLTERGLGAVINTHFPAHALAFGGKTLLVPYRQPTVYGNTVDIMTEDRLSAVFDVPVRIRELDFPERSCTVVLALPPRGR